ncbi:hypothetical protein INT47_006381 [Mucor saturninus]|uniref:Uncharacterized protein n=1 Tax=Mucor saturninus TaxID=64648 RepID=A0A8H7RKE2_9FUNG|nr:hypothetical protein INT47_006381 [Mucor saturninus]
MESKTVSVTSSRRHTLYGEPNSTRNSMDLIEGTTQHYQGLNKKTDARVQRQRWDAFFEPQYSFGAFIHGLNQQEEEDQFIQHQKKIDRLVDDGNQLREMRVAERPSLDMYSTENSTATMTPTLPDMSLTEKEERWGPEDENTLIERLELLKKMRAQATDVETEGEHDREEQEAHTARWKRNISEKAKQFCKEAQDDDESVLSSLDPDEKNGIHDDEEAAAAVKTFGCRRSFLCFLLGFLFPPLWLLGAFYFSSQANRQSSASRRIDRIWRRRSRIAFGIFIISLMIVLVVVFVLNPDSIGWRQSKLAGH